MRRPLALSRLVTVLMGPVVLACGGLGCANDSAWQGPAPSADIEDFAVTAYPVLLRDCAFSQCHGGRFRFFQVYGPGRVRMDPMSEPSDPATKDELRHSLDRALSMLQTDARLERSLLLTKPLEPAAGGQGHKGLDELGRNVYASKSDDGYVALEAWSRRAVDDNEDAQ